MGGTDHATITNAMQGGVVSNITTQQISNTSTGSVGGGGGGY
jgi:hypothetical protein